MAKYQSFLSRIGSNRDRAALRGIFSQFLTDDDPPALKDLVLASIILSGAETTQITISGASTTGILLSGASTTPINITGAFTTGITIAADGTTGISITSAFSGVNAISLAGTGSTAGINISGNHTTAITIGAQTTAGLAITGATATGISVTGACSTAALQIGASGTPAGDFIWYGTTALYKVLFDADGDTNGAVYFGVDTKGLLVNLYGDTTGCGVFWDPSTDTNGTLSIGASGGSKGNDLTAYGATNGNYMHWDQSADDLLLVGTSTQFGVAGTTDSSSTATGSIHTAGGLGVAKKAFFGDTVSVPAMVCTSNVGTANTGVTAVEYGDGYNHVTVLTVSQAAAITLGDNASLADGYLLYTLPAGAVIIERSYMSMAVTNAEHSAETPDVGLGTTIGSGENVTLDGVDGGNGENILTGQTANDCNGTAEVKTVTTELVIEAASAHTVHFNVACAWADTAGLALDADIAGTVVLVWKFMA